MWDIIQNYHYATIKTFEELEIHFLHNIGNEQNNYQLIGVTNTFYSS